MGITEKADISLDGLIPNAKIISYLKYYYKKSLFLKSQDKPQFL